MGPNTQRSAPELPDGLNWRRGSFQALLFRARYDHSSGSERGLRLASLWTAHQDWMVLGRCLSARSIPVSS